MSSPEYKEISADKMVLVALLHVLDEMEKAFPVWNDLPPDLQNSIEAAQGLLDTIMESYEKQDK